MEKTKNFLQIESLPFIGVKEYLIPDTQRDARNSQTGNLEAHNHCKSTSSTVAWNFFGKKYGDKFPILKTVESMGEFNYDSNLRPFLQKYNPVIQRAEKIQDWFPHVRMFEEWFKNNNLPFKCNFTNFRMNEQKIYESMKKGFPVILGTMITDSGHIVLLYRKLNLNGLDIYVIIDPYGNPLTTPKYTNKTADYYSIPKAIFDTWIDKSCNCIWFEEK